MASTAKEVASSPVIAASPGNRTARVLLLAGRLALGGIFLYAAYTKLYIDGRWHLGDYHFFFAMTINSYQLPALPVWLVLWTARIFPWLELLLGALLIFGVGLRWAGSAVTLLLLMFMALLTRAALLGLEINCGCFGSSYVKPSTELFHDSGLLILALAVTVGAFLTRRARRLPA
jgi:putative oxidoreductase